MHRSVVLFLMGIASGCAVGSFGASGSDDGAHGGGAGGDASAPAADGGVIAHDGSAASDAPPGADGASASDGGGGSTDASSAHDSGGGGVDASAASDSGLDPLLDPPDANGVPCSTPGSENGCPAIEVCRIASADGGRCEGCSNCGNLGSPCSASSDCDILFQCYAGKCSNICPLGTSYCGAVSDCLNVGNLSYGVCR